MKEVNPEGGDRTPRASEMTDTRRRVKLYALSAERQWDDRGTGHVSSSYVDRLKGMSLLVRAESDGTASTHLTNNLHSSILKCFWVVKQCFIVLRFTPIGIQNPTRHCLPKTTSKY